MATFDPRMPEVQAHVSVTQGVQDDTASKVLAAGWEVGKAVWQGSVQADLVGAENHEDNVSTADQYGAFEHDEEGNPLSLAIDTDLTKIANARKQGRLSASRTRAQANLRIREAINDNPMFAKEIAERGQRFFGNVLGGSGTGTSSGSVLEPTTEEKLEEKLQTQMTTELMKEELAAQQLGMDLPTYRQHQRAAYLHDFNAKQLEGNQKLNQVEIQRGVSSAQTLAEQDMMTRLTTARQTHGDLLSEPVRQEMRAAVLHHRNTMVAAVNRHRADVGGAQATEMESNLGRWADNMVELIDSGNLESMAEAGLTHTETMAKLQTWNEMPTVVRLFAISPELGKMHLDILTSSPARLELLAAVSPAARFLKDHGVEGFNAAQTMAPYLGEAMTEFATGQRTPQPEGMAENADMEIARDFTAVETIAAGQGNDAMMQHLQDMARDTPESLGALLTRTNRHRMNTDPAYHSQAEQALRVGVEGIERGVASGQYDLGAVHVRETTDHERRQAQDPRADGFGAGRWRGLQDTRIESNPDAVRQFAIDRQRGARDNMDPNDVARRLQTVMSVAEMYPDMKINGVNAKEYINTMIRGDATGVPWMREEQIQDVEFNDQVIGGEEGSGVGGIEAGPLMERTSEEEVLANTPDTGPDRLAQALESEDVPSAVDSVYSHLARREGEGDTLTDVPTGDMGVTAAARGATGATADTPDHVVAKNYLELLDTTFTSRVDGYKESPDNVKSMILDAGYNIGEGMANWPKFKAAMAAGDYRQAGLELLDSANVDGQTVRGLALRRAESFNLLGEEQIAFVEQAEDGTIKYLDKDDNVISQYTSAGGRHPQSRAIKSPVLTEEKIQTRNTATTLFIKSLEMFSR